MDQDKQARAASTPSLGWIVVVLAVAAMLVSYSAPAEVISLDIERREVVAEGQSFGLAGPYEKLVGKVRFALDAADPGNAAIVDLDKAPKGEDGRVHFSADVRADHVFSEPETRFPLGHRGHRAYSSSSRSGGTSSCHPTQARVNPRLSKKPSPLLRRAEALWRLVHESSPQE